jgi:hypothetical protein
MKINFNKLPRPFRGTDIYEQAGKLAYAYVTNHAAADADGAPNAYSPADLGKPCSAPHVGLDCLDNAGYPHTSWWKDVLVPDKAYPSKAFVQTTGPGKGFFLSMTSLHKGDAYSAPSYVDATTFPYVVIPSGFPAFYANAAAQGDVGYATYLDSGAATAFIIADSGGGPDAKLGEASIALFAALGFPNANPRTGAGLPSGDIQYILFPGSGKKVPARWPRTNQDIHDQVIGLLQTTPGIEFAAAPAVAAEALAPAVVDARVERMPVAGPRPTKPKAAKRGAKRKKKTAARKSGPSNMTKRGKKTSARKTRPPYKTKRNKASRRKIRRSR